MTIDEVAGPVMLPLAFALAVLSALWMLQHVARRYPSMPKRIPLRIRADGRPAKRLVGKQTVWIAPAIVTALIAAFGIAVFVVRPPAGDDRTIAALTFLIGAEIAYFVAWLTDRKIEIARKMTYRLAPARTLRAALPMLVTIAIALAVAARL